LNEAKRLNDWNGWNGLRYYSAIERLERLEPASVFVSGGTFGTGRGITWRMKRFHAEVPQRHLSVMRFVAGVLLVGNLKRDTER
jgi:hypothetical protein